ncbi:MAG: carboxypeptidase regulatory-like domain-containing protein [Pyrinomonadaceae bacterium]
MRHKTFFERKAITLGAAAAIIFTVAGAKAFGASFTVSNLNDSGAGSLRQAILSANAAGNSGNTPDEIHVQTGLAPGTIDLLSPLPAVTDAVRIINDGTGSGRIQLNGLATRNQAVLSIGLDFEAPNCATASPACELWGFAINRFGEAGIRVGLHTDNLIITQNYIGTDIDGATTNCTDANNNAISCGNFNEGILIAGAQNVRIGTDATTPDAGCPLPAPCGHSNTIGGNLGKGIVVGNGYDAGNNLVGGSAIIRNNYIGISNGFPSSGAAIGNAGDGILIAGTSNNQIGGTTNNSPNYIGSNGYNGIEIVPDTGSVNTPASNNTVQGNVIGQTPGSATARGNSGSGIVVRGSNNLIGGTTAAARNVVVSNAVAGIAISGGLAGGNTVQGNLVGVASNGTTALGNLVAGIQVSQYATGNTIGGSGGTAGSCTGPCNLVANNGSATAQSAKAGVYVDQTASTGNTVRENSIFGNGSGTGIGIDVGAPGATANDAGDTDNVQNSPTLSSASTSGFINGSLSSTPNTSFTIDFYLNQSSDAGPMDQGRTWIGSKQVTTDGSGSVSFNYTVTGVTMAQGQNVTATATRGAFTSRPNAPTAPSAGSTSEFSNGIPVTNITTAASVSVSGRVTTASGSAVSGAVITMTGQNGKSMTARTNAFGYFTFTEIPSGDAYVVGTERRGFAFDSFLLQVRDSLTNLSIKAK